LHRTAPRSASARARCSRARVAASPRLVCRRQRSAAGFEFSFRERPVWVSEARGFDGPVAALALDESGNLWCTPERRTRHYSWPHVQRMRKGISLERVADHVDHPKVEWQRLQAELAPLADNTHIEFLVYTSNDAGEGPTVSAGSGDPLSDPKWRQRIHPPASDLDDIYVGGDPQTYLWVGAPILRRRRLYACPFANSRCSSTAIPTWPICRDLSQRHPVRRFPAAAAVALRERLPGRRG